MQLETISCPLCNCSDARTVFRSRDFRFKSADENFNIVKCKDCGFTYLNPRPDENEIAKFYPSDFNEIDRSLFYTLLNPCFKLAQQSTIKFFKKYKRGGKALDVGCGNGEFILAMQRHSFDAWGVEINSAAKEFTDRRLEGRIIYKDIEECGFSPKSFDIITMFQSLEHIYDLGALFTEINRVLKDDGLLYICVPDSDFFEARLFGPYYYNLEIPRHLYFFTRKSLEALLLKHGFKVTILLKESLYEMVSTPASFYHGIWNFLSDRGIRINNAIKSLTYVPLVMIRLIIRLIFLFQGQNLKALCIIKA